MENIGRYMVANKKITINGERKKIREKTKEGVKVFWVYGPKTLIYIAKIIWEEVQKKS